VSFSETPETAIPSIYGAIAYFYPGAAPSATCAGTQNGNCCYVPPASGSSSSSSSSSSSGTVTIPGAGAITVTDGTTPMGTLAFTAGTGYAPLGSATDTMLTWAFGDTLNVSAVGDANGVAAFTGAVVAPASLANLSPALSYTAPTGLSLSSDFVETWTAGPAGSTVTLAIYATTSAFAPNGSITCTADDSSGTITVPTALLANFGPTDTGSASLSRSASTAVTASNANVTVVANVYGAGGSLSFGGVIDAGPPAGPLFTKPTALINNDQFDTSTGTDPSQTLFAGLLATATIPYSEYTEALGAADSNDPTVAEFTDGGVTNVIWFSGTYTSYPLYGGTSVGEQEQNIVDFINAGGHTVVFFAPGIVSENGNGNWTGSTETDPLFALIAQGDTTDLYDDTNMVYLYTEATVTVTGGANSNFSGQHWTVNQPATSPVLTPSSDGSWNALNPLAASGSATFDALATVSADDQTGNATQGTIPVIVGAKHIGTMGSSTVVFVGFNVENLSSADQATLFTAIATYAGLP
jgi:hypothetical protein